MKKLICLLSIFFITSIGYSQNDSVRVKKMYRIMRTDGIQMIGQILNQDAREILIHTKEGRNVYVPQYMIKDIKEITTSDLNVSGEYTGEDRFATRYFLNTNGLPIRKGENYIQWNLFGPDFQFGIGKNLSVGVMTSWLGVPIIGSIKQSFQISDHVQLAIGGLVGTGSWAAFGYGGALPFATLSFGNRKSNLSFSGGYGVIWADGETSDDFLGSIAGMTKVGPKLSLVFDSFFLLANDANGGFGLLIPGVRWHQGEGKAFQFGFTGVIIDGELVPFPIPMIQWFRAL